MAEPTAGSVQEKDAAEGWARVHVLEVQAVEDRHTIEELSLRTDSLSSMAVRMAGLFLVISEACSGSVDLPVAAVLHVVAAQAGEMITGLA